MANVNTQRLELGSRLRAARTAAGVSAREVEQRLGWHQGKVSRVETGVRVPRRAEVDVMCEMFGLGETERESLRALASEAAKRVPMSSRVADFAQSYTVLEDRAASIDYLDEVLVPGLLQTEGYARALLAMSHSEHRKEHLDARLARQAILHREHPPRLRVILGEAALHRQVGGREVMREQLQYLIDAGELPHVEIRILPFAVGAHRAIGVGFTLVRVSDPLIERVYQEGLTRATYIHEADEVDVYGTAFETVWAAARGPVESATIIRSHIGKSED